MPDRRRWFIPASPSGLIESPDQIDVLAEPQLFVESTDGIEGGGSYDERGGGNIADPSAAPNSCRLITEVERRPDFAGHAWSHQANIRVVKVGEQRVKPRADADVIEEID